MGWTTSIISDALQLNAGAAGQPPSVFSQACKLHEVIDGDTLFAVSVNGTYLYDALVDWFFNGTRYEVRTVPENAIPHCTSVVCWELLLLHPGLPSSQVHISSSEMYFYPAFYTIS